MIKLKPISVTKYTHATIGDIFILSVIQQARLNYRSRHHINSKLNNPIRDRYQVTPGAPTLKLVNLNSSNSCSLFFVFLRPAKKQKISKNQNKNQIQNSKIHNYTTSSNPPLDQGPHFKILITDKPKPLKKPCFIKDCFAYSEQVGV